MRGAFKLAGLLLVLLAAAALAWVGLARLGQEDGRRGPARAQPAPVQVAPVERGSLELRRTFSGTLEATARFVVAPKVGGRVERLAVDLADSVSRGQVVAELDDDEYVQALAQAEADLAVARANLFQAERALEIAERELSRVATLRQRGVASDSQYDEAKAGQLAGQARFQVARAQLARARASVETANIRLGYTKVTADWSGAGGQRVVAERFVDEGETVGANAPLMAIVALSPITGVVFVPERDYAGLRPGQPVSLATDAHPGREFAGRVDRVAPVFKESSRQARVELAIPNQDRLLKPGMFVRATVVLRTVQDAVLVPEEALVSRRDRTGVFVVDQAGERAVWRPVAVGIRQGGRVQIMGPGVSGRVIVLGQQLVEDGSPITIPRPPASGQGGGA
jgi:RND family efflux transporter MFP subunit